MTGLGQVGALGRLGAPALARGGWWLSGSELDLYFANNRAFNRSTGFNGSPNGILTYTSPSPKMVYGDDGVLRYAPHNLLTYSEDLTQASAWLSVGVAVTANQAVAPDGTLTADLIVPATAAGSFKSVRRIPTVLPAGGNVVASIYAKPAGYNYLTFLVDNSVGRVTINVLDGTYTTYAGSFVATTTPLADGWYRVDVSFLSTNASSSTWWGAVATQSDMATSWSGDGVSGMYLWGAQVSRGQAFETYLPTTTAAVYSLPIDHNPTTFAPLGVLIEEQRVNLLTYSEQFDNAAWANTLAGTGTIPTKTANAGVAPDGTTTADRLVLQLNGGTTTSDAARLRQSATTTAAAHTLSVWLKSYDGVSTYSMGIQLSSTATAITVTGEWQRFTLTVTTTAASQANDIFIRGGQTPTHSGAADILVWGAQLEAGAFATSYIPTVASQVTRAADRISIAQSGYAFNANAGTFGAEYDLIGYVVNYRVVSGGSSYRYFYGPGTVTTLSSYNGSATITTTVVSPVGNATKVAMSYDGNGRSITDNGNAISGSMTDANAFLTASTTTAIGTDPDGSSPLNGHIKRLTYWNTRKTNAELQALSA